ncbi:hypothetical protein Ptr902_06067 [Pyrenophora tritici-repentis]|uniref:Uncharacterized protein n=1 Tax=Pyrenophora tritici-repentis (strain Pt-1C-BFP) TaxID=426418 RepID=B2WPL0_PYRTR|nr:uncharacterized protein PTRG_11961 [Pyrenophora tritici-repentis Pt-1C-BFP]EDU46076.1 predicted protein [Pyrenophora tritici-repentis Pt-1C-BFP]KAI2483750.1 hypothetical protein Ptr902_06067 [Pyrenophora tritici-repentis]PZD39762.1 hypothetical protein A1F97_05625 [Pyrenophora tritici-repentis]
MHSEIEAQAASRYYGWQWQRFLLFTRQQTVHVSQQWMQAPDNMQNEIIERVNAALAYEKIPKVPDGVIHWRMETLLNRRTRTSYNESGYGRDQEEDQTTASS